MAYQPTCLVCQKVMELGFITDLGNANLVMMQRWCPGEPTPKFWSGDADGSQYREGRKVVAYRCPECKALRLYAHDPD